MKKLSRFIFILGLLIICLSDAALALNHQAFTLRLITYAFWILSLAVIIYIWEIKNEK